MLEKAIELQEKLVAAEKKKGELLHELGRALLIQKIWPEAFESGPCTFSGLLAWDRRFNVTNSFRQAWFQRADGVRKYLTAEELKQFKPEAEINQNYTTTPD